MLTPKTSNATTLTQDLGTLRERYNQKSAANEQKCKSPQQGQWVKKQDRAATTATRLAETPEQKRCCQQQAMQIVTAATTNTKATEHAQRHRDKIRLATAAARDAKAAEQEHIHKKQIIDCCCKRIANC